MIGDRLPSLKESSEKLFHDKNALCVIASTSKSTCAFISEFIL
ncbi:MULTISPECIES: hypothetical protein [unclassified Campylobacter]|nr:MULTISPECIES: hypothetical protein [unclassified Campylobacter]